jgi:hypothetical protein
MMRSEKVLFMDGKKQKLNLPKTAFQLKVTLLEIDPPIWRRLAVPCSITFHKLHQIMQAAMGWQDYHLYNFTVGGVHYGIPDPEFEFDCKDSRRIKLERVLKEKLKFIYVYDFGDNREHRIQVEKILHAEHKEFYPVCLGGERACPPEDVGGTWGYIDFLEAISDSDHEENEDLLSWADEDFDAEHFDLQAVNEGLRKLR